MTEPDSIMYVHTIYDHPADYPNEYVARTFVVSATLDGPTPTGAVFGSKDLDLVRRWVQQIAPGSVCFPRMEEDDPVIMETWM